MENITLLVEKCREGDQTAFAQIVERYQGMVSAVTLNIVGDYAQSEDLAQETFLTAWRKMPELREPGKLPSWLYGMAKRIALDWSKRQQRNPLQRATELDEHVMHDHQVQSEAERREQHERSLQLVWSTVKELPETYREPLLLYYRYSRSMADIAESMQLTEEAVRQRLSRGRKMLKAEVEKRVESVLELTRPDTAFTLAVMAALPTVSLLGASTALAGTTTATGGSIAGKGAGLAGVGLFAWLIGAVWIGLVSIIIPLLSLFGGFNVIITQTRNSPTVRSRRLLIRDGMMRVGIAMFLMGSYFFIAALPTEWLSFNVKVGCIILLVIAFFNNIYMGALWTNKYWREIVEEDLGRRPPPNQPVEESWFSLRALRWTFGMSLSMFCLGLAGFMFFVWNLSLGIPSVVFRNLLFYGFLLFQALPIGLFLYVYRRTIEMATEEGLEKYPPTIPNILDIVLGKAEMPEDRKTLRGRMGGDMLGMGALIFTGSTQPVILGLIQPNPWPGYLVIAVSVIGFTLFAWLVAGKPKVRHLGWMLTSFFFTGFYAWILWGGVFREQFAAMPPVELAVLFIYVLFFFAGFAGFFGFIGLFEKEVNRKLGIPERDDVVAEK